MKKIIIGVGLVFIALYLCWSRGMFNPPISISFRQSLISGYVLQIRSLSNKPIECTMSVYNDSMNRKRENMQFVIQPGETQELGLLELDWKFEPGEYGWVSVSGYLMKLNYELHNSGGWKVW